MILPDMIEVRTEDNELAFECRVRSLDPSDDVLADAFGVVFSDRFQRYDFPRVERKRLVVPTDELNQRVAGFPRASKNIVGDILSDGMNDQAFNEDAIWIDDM
jgi:hypothetical protein